MLRAHYVASALIAGGASAAAAPLPPCVPAIEASGVRVIRVEQDGVIVLDDGRAVHLEGILLPAGARDHAPQFLARQAIGTLSGLVTGRNVTLAAQPPKEDRYGRLRAEVFLAGAVEGAWVQAALLSRGLARVEIAPDRRECAGPLRAAEDAARKQRLAIWAQQAYAVLTPEQISGEADAFRIVEGRIVAAQEIGGRVFLEFGRDPHKSFAAVVAHQDIKTFRESGIDPLSYAARRVRVRGWVESRGRPVMEIAVPEAIEVLDTPSL